MKEKTLDPANDEYSRWRTSEINKEEQPVEQQRRTPSVYDIEITCKTGLSTHKRAPDLEELYREFNVEEYKNPIVVGENIKKACWFGSEAEKMAEAHVIMTRHILRYEKSAVAKFHNEEKWKETLKKMDQARHDLHNKLKAEIAEVIGVKLKSENINTTELDAEKIACFSEIVIGNAIGKNCIHISKLLLNEKVIVIAPRDPGNVIVDEFRYVSDWHDPGNEYRQAFIFYNPLKYGPEDIKYVVEEDGTGQHLRKK